MRQTVLRWVKRLAWTAVAVTLVALVAIELAYRWFLPEQLPEPPAEQHPLTLGERAIWASLAGGPVQLDGVYPWHVARAVFSVAWDKQSFRRRPGDFAVASHASRLHVVAVRPRAKMLKHHAMSVATAIWISRNFSAEQLARWYGQRAHFGRGAYGLEEASAAWFGKPAAALTLAEAATLAGLPQSPTRYGPDVNPELAAKRRAGVLEEMRQAGMITAAQAEAAAAEQIAVAPSAIVPRQ